MVQKTSPFIEGKYGWDYGESGWHMGMDENLLKFSYLFDKNIDGIVSSLPAASNGKAYFLTTDNRIYFAVGNKYYSTPVPKWTTVTLRTTGVNYTFNGTTLVEGSTLSGVGDAVLRQDLSNSTDTTKGATLVKNKFPATTAQPISLRQKASYIPFLEDFAPEGKQADGNTDWTSEIQAWWNWAQQEATGYASLRSGGANIHTATLRLKGGIYNYNGPALSNSAIKERPIAIWSDSPKKARIVLQQNDYLIDAQRCRNFFSKNLEIVGGKGFVTWPGGYDIVAERYLFEDCVFYDYTEAAINSCSVDHPSPKIHRCDFYGNGKGIFGIAWGGYCDEMAITDCNFGGNKYHIRIGSNTVGTSGNWKIERNGFFSGLVEGHKVADIWIVPRGEFVNSGFGGIIAENKFGIERRDTLNEQNTSRILIADQDTTTGTSSSNYLHKASSSSGYCAGITVTENNIAGTTGESRGIVLTYAKRTSINVYNNIRQGSAFPYVIEYADPSESLFITDSPVSQSRIEPPLKNGLSSGNMGVITRLSNKITSGVIFNPFGDHYGSGRSVSLSGDDNAYRLLRHLRGQNFSQAGGTGTTTAIDDGRGGTSAITAQFVNDDHGYFVTVPMTNYVSHLPIWIEVDLKKSTETPIEDIAVAVNRYSPNFAVAAVYPVALKSDWVTARLCVNWQDEATTTLSITIRNFSSVNWSVGTKDKVCIGNIRVYQSNAPHSGIRPGLIIPGDSNATLALDKPRNVLFSGALTASRSVTLPTTNAVPGDMFRVTNTSTGGFSVTVGSTTLSANQWAEFVYNGSTYSVVARGSTT